MTSARSSRLIVVGLFSLCATTAYLVWKQNSSSIDNMSSSGRTLQQLAVSLRQSSSSASGVAIKVTNTGKEAVTILRWESPLDPLALQLGLLSLTPAESTEPLKTAVINVSRQLPPDEESLVTLEPGASKENEILFRDPIVPLDQIKGKKIAVACKGRWVRVWSGRRSDLSAETIGKLGAGDGTSSSGDFESKSIEMEVN